MTPLNETPPIAATDFPGAALGTVVAHVVRDSSGTITSGTVDFIVDYKYLGGTITVTGLHIHKGAAGVAGPIVIPTDISANNPVTNVTGNGQIVRAAQVMPTDTAGLDALNGMFADPSGFYINLHTPEHPGGAIRAQLSRPTTIRLMGLMTPQQETPPITDLNASAVVSVTISATQGDSPETTAARVTFDMKYAFPSQVTFIGFHIHRAPAGTAGPIILDSGISGSTNPVMSDPSGSGTLHREFVVSAFDPTVTAEQAAIKGLFANPGDFYINAHTPEHPGGAVRAQLRRVDDVVYQVNMLPSNETPPITGLAASAPARIVVNTLRGDDGSAIAAAVTFDVNYRFPGAATFTGLHIHDGAAGVAGPIHVPTDLSGANSVMSATGFGNISRLALVSDTAGLATVNSILSTPQNQYVNLHTTVNPGGAVRAQIAPAAVGLPKIDVNGVISAVNDKALTTAAPGDLITIYGTNLASNSSGLGAFEGQNVPTSFNGVQVTIGGKAAPLIYVSPRQINAQVPFDTAAGAQPLIVMADGTASAAYTLMVAATAPGIFVDAATGNGILVKQDFSLLTSDNRAHAN
ncbi:MAG: CHRD domain-containing protein, partial [Acidobacteriota bacterium]|nr:CHRD domain-containing protein [Acidobacteriota bacterium]